MSRGLKILVIIACVLGALYYGLTWFVDSQVEKGIKRAAELRGAEVRWDGLDVSLLERTVALTGVSVHWQDRDYAAKRVDFKRLDSKGTPPEYAHVVVDGADIPITAQVFGWAAPVLQGMGITRLQGDLALDYIFDTGNNSLRINNLSADLTDLGSLTMGALLHNLSVEDLTPERLVGLQFGKSDITFSDAGLLDKLSSVLVPGPQEQRRELFAQSMAMLARGAEARKQEHVSKAYDGLARFIRDGGTVTISTNPEEPVPWLYVYMGNSLDRMVKLLGLEISTDR